MYLPWPIGYGSNGLGALGAEPGCDEPVSTAERDALRNELAAIINDYTAQTPKLGKGGHWHEGHPDIRAYLADIIPRMDGLKFRAKLLRCDAEARDRARRWIGNIHDLLSRVKKTVPLPAGGTGSMTVIPEGGINVPLYRSRTYHIRGPWYAGRFQPVGGGQEIPKPPAKDLGPAPAAPTQPVMVGEPLPQATNGGPGILPPEIAGVWNELTAGDVAGIPKKYIVYGILGLIGYRLLFRR